MACPYLGAIPSRWCCGGLVGGLIEGGLMRGLWVGVHPRARLALWVMGTLAVVSMGFCVWAVWDTQVMGNAVPAAVVGTESNAGRRTGSMGASVPTTTMRPSQRGSRTPYGPPAPTRTHVDAKSPSRVTNSPSGGHASTTSSMSPSTSLDGSIHESRFAGSTPAPPIAPPTPYPHLSPSP